MGVRRDLSGERYGNLTVLEKAEGLQDRYYVWLCRCDCGKELLVNTRNLTAHRMTHCGCKSNKTQRRAEEDKSSKKKKPKYKDITGYRKGQLTALYPTDKRDNKGSVIWHCRCDCGNEIELSESDIVFGFYVSCGCVRRQRLDNFGQNDNLTFIDGTCVEWLANRKNRADNTSGFRGVYKRGKDSYRVCIGLQGKRYDLGHYKSFDEAVAVRLDVEKHLHDGFLTSWSLWKEMAEKDEEWAKDNPFFFSVKMEERKFLISSAVTKTLEFQY